jgi:K+ potassium transporter
MQAITQNFFPRFSVIHTNREHHGQIYIPVVSYYHPRCFQQVVCVCGGGGGMRVGCACVPGEAPMSATCWRAEGRESGVIAVAVQINFTLMTLTIIIVATFQTSARIGHAYGADGQPAPVPGVIPMPGAAGGPA